MSVLLATQLWASAAGAPSSPEATRSKAAASGSPLRTRPPGVNQLARAGAFNRSPVNTAPLGLLNTQSTETSGSAAKDC